MKIIFEQHDIDKLRDRHILLELDTVIVQGVPRRFFCLLENFSYTDIPDVYEFAKSHQEFMNLYQAKKYTECEVLLEKLQSYNYHDMKSFYDIMTQRLQKLQNPEIVGQENVLIQD
jgi:hypothetical protein